MIADAKEKDMTSGPSGRQIFFFALPLMMGNIFQWIRLWWARWWA